MRLRFDEATGTLKLTCPSRASRRTALAWALDQRDWIEAQLARVSAPEPFAPDALILVEGQEVRIAWHPAAPRVPVLRDKELRVGGLKEGVARRTENFLKKLALDTMSREVAEYAAAIGVMAACVSIGDAGSRWGSCSSQGRIRLCWRLILAEPAVRRYVVAHEVAHLVHLDHSPKFKALEAQLYGPGLSEAKATLRRIGPRLRRIGRSG
ncbi:MAG TPA: SprT family zinc-dependent metalloprotease [Sphingomicrobium sp.]|nr:SprT family zinc-dependent metalloprotease [Sphingomicrobium sp.]